MGKSEQKQTHKGSVVMQLHTPEDSIQMLMDSQATDADREKLNQVMEELAPKFAAFIHQAKSGQTQ